MSLGQLTGKEMDEFEHIWTRIMLASGLTLIASLVVVYVFWSDREMFFGGAVATASIVALLIAAAKLREFGCGLSGSDREERGNMHSALQSLND